MIGDAQHVIDWNVGSVEDNIAQRDKAKTKLEEGVEAYGSFGEAFGWYAAGLIEAEERLAIAREFASLLEHGDAEFALDAWLEENERRHLQLARGGSMSSSNTSNLVELIRQEARFKLIGKLATYERQARKAEDGGEDA